MPPVDADVSWLGLFDTLLAGTKDNPGFGVGNLIEGKGNYDLGVHPDWVGNAGITWAMDPIRVGVRGRFVGPYKECADIFLQAFAGQTSVPWPSDFPRVAQIPDPAVRELHPQPSDDSAFQP